VKVKLEANSTNFSGFVLFHLRLSK